MSINLLTRTTLISAIVLLLFSVSGNSAEAAIDCFSCHDKDAFQKRVSHDPAGEGECLTCHNPHVARFAGLLQQKVKDLCYSCHSDASEKQSQGLVHTPVLQGDCLGCHDPHASNYSGLLKGRPADICFSCHDDMPKKFKNTHLPYAQGECSSCHQAHQSDYPYLLNDDPDSLCMGCHSSSSLAQKHTGFPDDLGNCGSCHNPHGSDRPGLVRNVLHDPFAEGCNDCHKGRNSPVRIDTCLNCHPEVSEEMSSSHNHLVRYEENGCIACHTPHAGDDERLLKGKQRHVCGNCHEATFERYENAEFSHPQTDSCNDCHAPHGSNHPAMVKTSINQVCSECHGEHGVFTHPIGENVFDPRTGQVMTCISCHATKGTSYDFHTWFDRKKALCVQCHAEY